MTKKRWGDKYKSKNSSKPQENLTYSVTINEGVFFPAGGEITHLFTEGLSGCTALALSNKKGTFLCHLMAKQQGKTDVVTQHEEYIGQAISHFTNFTESPPTIVIIGTNGPMDYGAVSTHKALVKSGVIQKLPNSEFSRKFTKTLGASGTFLGSNERGCYLLGNSSIYINFENRLHVPVGIDAAS